MTRSRVILLCAVIAIAAAIAWAFRRPPVRVDVASIRRGPLQVTVDEEGETRVRNRFIIAAPVAGRLERITLDEGDTVEGGAVVARMHPLPLDPRTVAEASARVEAAEAQEREADAHVAQAQAALAQARRTADRARRLARNGTISAEELEGTQLAEVTRQRELEAAEFGARAADRNVAAARAALLAPGSDAVVTPCGDDGQPCVAIHSPASGRVLRVREESERVVAVGTPLLELGDPQSLEVVIDVLSEDAVKVHPGDQVLIEDWGGDTKLHARVRLVEPSGFTKISALGVEEQRVNVIADFVDSPGALGDGYRLEARIVVWERPDVLIVPTSALFRRGTQWNVFLVRDGRALEHPIEIGQRNALEAEALSGLELGDTVILHPSDLIGDGTRVKAAPIS